MIPNPNTKEGRAEIEKRLAKSREEAKKLRERIKTNIDDEPTGKLTEPSELDIRRDRKNEE